MERAAFLRVPAQPAQDRQDMLVELEISPVALPQLERFRTERVAAVV